MDHAAWKNHLAETVQKHSDLQTWNGYLDIRLPHLQKIADESGLEKAGRLLEIGCGNGLGSAFFANRAVEVVATDLSLEDSSAHSIGLEKARRLFEVLKLSNVELVGCSAEDLPFPDRNFDTVLSVFSLEHVPDRLKCLKECARVLRPGGRFVAAVPAAAWSVFYPLAFYSELGKRALKRFRRNVKKGGLKEIGTRPVQSAPLPVVKDWKSFRKVYPHFPLPKPHGEYGSYWEELTSQRTSKWVELLQKAGFESVKAVPLSVLPRLLLSDFLGSHGLAPYRRLAYLDDRMSRSPMMAPFAQILCLTGTKSSSRRARKKSNA